MRAARRHVPDRDGAESVGAAREGADPDADLDGVAPPPGCDPTLVVWREYRGLADRVRVYATTFLLYTVVAVIVEWQGPGRLDSTFSFIFDGVCVFFAVGQGWLMTNPGQYYAAGQTWMIAWTEGRRRRPVEVEQAARGARTLRFADLRRAELGTKSEGWTRITVPLLRCEDVHGTRWALRLSVLQSCPPLRTLFEPALDGRDVMVGVGVREALHSAPRPKGAPTGIPVVRAGSGL